MLDTDTTPAPLVRTALAPIRADDALAEAGIALAGALGALAIAEGPGIARARSEIEQARIILKLIRQSQRP